jgi:AraC family L-rhamnose operon regulatory protein RhaS
MVREYNDGKPGYQSMVKAKLIELLISISRCYEELITKPMTTSATDIEIINRTAIFIQSHFHQPLSLSQISQICGMSKTSFSLKFKKYYGQTFIEYRNELRIHKACQLLTSTNMKIVSVAHQVGFNELSNFNRVFRQYTNTSPGQYREDNKRKI